LMDSGCSAAYSVAERVVYELPIEPLVSEMNCGRRLTFCFSHPANWAMTTFGSSNASVCSRVCPLTPRASGIQCLGNRLQLAVEAAGQTGFHDHRAERDHRIIARDRAVGVDIHHDEGHIPPRGIGLRDYSSARSHPELDRSPESSRRGGSQPPKAACAPDR
jgi:hypothetical protein